MVRFLSPDWFAEVARLAPPRPRLAAGAGAGAGSDDDLVLEQVVRDGPEGEVRYRVVVAGGDAYLEPPGQDNAADGALADRAADLTISCDWATAAALAQGQLSAQSALMEGRLRVRGNLARLAGRAGELLGLDPVPEDVRRRTTY